MWTPRVAGVVERRLLVNYRLDPDVAARLVPAPFRPQLVGGAAVAGICLIRMGSLRPAGLPGWLGVRSENAAHRFAVSWESGGETRHGVYIPRRDSSSALSVLVGSRVFTGEYHRADFSVREDASRLRVGFVARDGSARVAVDVSVAADLRGSRLFPDVAAASAFFEQGSVGFSATRAPGRFDGMALRTDAWAVEPGIVRSASSSYFDALPPGSAELDSVLVMRQVPVVWDALPALDAAAV